ncbi:hypothetical protein SCP_1104150 [Sparassis crispa]|uniref:Uncharacterized protein n=1 Tax=Sparassis crispa TaxID=139825 RepID=A0A401GZZ7_9APHY|nr:hypothetical protein SCP_1104150 [Sparassis crispa]GBE87738.1 hypothetical protein SCP_1104150 [Sparassis crispa]
MQIAMSHVKDIPVLFLWKIVGPAGAQESHLSATTNFHTLFSTRVASILISELHPALAAVQDMQEFTGMSCMDAGTWVNVNEFIVGVARKTAGLPAVTILGKIKVTYRTYALSETESSQCCHASKQVEY